MTNAKETTMNIRTGTCVITDSRLERGSIFEPLGVCDDWAEADYRLGGTTADGYALPYQAVNVEITGRKVRYDVAKLGGDPMVRVAITFVHEDEDDVTVGGWANFNTLEA